MADLINPAEMTSEKLYDLLRSAYMKPTLGTDGEIRLKGPSGFHQTIEVNAGNKFLKFMALFGLQEDRSRQEKLELVNRLNDGIVLSRFSMPREYALMADYHISFEEGMTALQILNCIHWFDKATIGAIRMYDESGLIK